jgi:glutathione S-transferase
MVRGTGAYWCLPREGCNSMITISAFEMVPPFAQGVVRDLRVRWALEEAGLPYQTKLIDPTIQGTAEYRALQPFGQVPIYEEDGFKLFETGSILLHIASRCPELMPADEVGRARNYVGFRGAQFDRAFRPAIGGARSLLPR